jgi:hypothetical protein
MRWASYRTVNEVEVLFRDATIDILLWNGPRQVLDVSMTKEEAKNLAAGREIYLTDSRGRPKVIGGHYAYSRVRIRAGANADTLVPAVLRRRGDDSAHEYFLLTDVLDSLLVRELERVSP